MKFAIITGSNGQDGEYLRELLQERGVEPVLVPHSSGVDLTNPIVVDDMIQAVRPDCIFHLAANSTVSHTAARQNHDLIATGTLNLLQAVQLRAPECRVFLAGSAYQFQNNGQPIRETDPWDTHSVYCAARGYSNLLARAYRHMGLKVYFGYFFHHDSPRRGERHISQQIAKAAREGVPIQIGDLDVVKEWTWAGDTVQAVWALVNQEAIWEANIGTGIGHSIGEFAEACYMAAGHDWRKFVQPKPGFVPDYRHLTCCPDRILSTGWRPIHGLAYLANQMVNAWKP